MPTHLLMIKMGIIYKQREMHKIDTWYSNRNVNNIDDHNDDDDDDQAKEQQQQQHREPSTCTNLIMSWINGSNKFWPFI